MTKYFYKNPLPAIWMEKYFGMKFQYWDFTEDKLVDFPFGLNAECEIFYMNDSDSKYYIHPDSLNLLRHRDDDLVTYKITMNDGQTYNSYGYYGYSKLEENLKIFYRGGQHFMWPESEE